jgi:hypothetical protein
VGLSGVNTHRAQVLFAVSHAVQLPPGWKQATKSPFNAACEHAPCAVAIGWYSTTGPDAPTLLGVQTPSAEGAADRLSGLPLVGGCDGLQPPLHKASTRKLVVATARIIAMRLCGTS